MPTDIEIADVKKLLGEVTERTEASPPSGMLVITFTGKSVSIGHTDNMQDIATAMKELLELADKVGRGELEVEREAPERLPAGVE